MNGIRIDTLDKFRKLKTQQDKIEALFELSLESVQKCQCRLKQCEKQFVKKMVLKDKYLPISKATFFTGAGMGIFLAGAGIFRPEQFVKWIKVILPFL